jgi:uncharacterized membrane protein
MNFIKTTLVGGVLYLVPIIVMLAIIGKAHQIASKLVVPLAANFPEGLFGFGAVRLLAIAAIVLFCFLAGLFARSKLAKRFGDWLESTVLANVPGYTIVKSIGESMVGAEQSYNYEAVLARIEDAWQVAFLIERIEGGHVAVFLPGAPNPASGSIYFMTEDRIKPIGLPLTEALKSVRRLGVGSNALLRGKL